MKFSHLLSTLDFFQFPFRPANSEQAKILWIVKLRWLASVLFLVFGSAALIFGSLSTQQVGAYLATIALLMVFNVFTLILFSDKQKSVRQVAVCFQLTFDLLVLGVCLYLTGGIENPFVPLFLLNASLGALLIPGYLTIPFLLLTHATLFVLQLDFLRAIPGAPNRPNVFFNAMVMHGLVFGFWFIMRSLGSYFEVQQEQQLQSRSLLEKQDRLRAIGALAAGFSHEFASPLNTAKIRVERLLRNHPGEDAAEAALALQVCEEVIRQMNHSQLDHREAGLRTVSVQRLISDILPQWKLDHPNVEVLTEILPGAQVMIPTINFAQVVLNLLDNAAQASASGRVCLRFDSDPFHHALTIEDEGPGFSASVIERLGEPFVTTKIDGTGLGLYVSRLFAQSLGGELRIANRKDASGARVSIEWPAGDLSHG